MIRKEGFVNWRVEGAPKSDSERKAWGKTPPLNRDNCLARYIYLPCQLFLGSVQAFPKRRHPVSHESHLECSYEVTFGNSKSHSRFDRHSSGPYEQRDGGVDCESERANHHRDRDATDKHEIRISVIAHLKNPRREVILCTAHVASRSLGGVN